MAVIFRIGNYRTSDVPDGLGRYSHGWFPRMTEAEAYEAGRGAWKLGPRVDNETFALIVAGTGPRTVLAAVEIEAVTDADDDGRRSVVGRVLDEGHPVRDAYLGQRDPVDNASRNPVGYVELPEEEPFRLRDCACGCQTRTRREFAPGHDQKAIHDRIRRHFDGSVLRFIRWIDQHGPAAGTGPDGRVLPDDPPEPDEPVEPVEPQDPAGPEGGYDERNGPPEDGDW